MIPLPANREPRTANWEPTENTMKLYLHRKGISAEPNLRQHLERRLGFALGRFGYRVRTVWAHLSDQNGPRGGIDKRCRLQARGAFGLATVEVDDTQIEAAIDGACDRLGRGIARALERSRGQLHQD